MTYRQEMRYAFHVLVHPFDGFWCIKRENRRSFRAALTIVALLVLNNIIHAQFLGYYFRDISYSGSVNLFSEILNALLPIFLWSLANWCFTTLMDGEGTFKDVLYATIYAYLPLALIGIPMTLLSNLLIPDESMFYQVLINFSYIWMGLLVFISSLVTHQYEVYKNVIVSILTIVGMGLIIFVALLFYNLIVQFFGFISSLYTEIVFRM